MSEREPDHQPLRPEARCDGAAMERIQDQRTAKEIRQAIKQREPIPKEWLVPSDRYGWLITLRILVPFFALFGTAPLVWLYVSPWLVLLWIPAIGVYGYKISFIMHDCSHHSLFRSRQLNDRVGDFCGYLVVANHAVFRRVHLNHHRFNGKQGDPQRTEAAGFQGASAGRLAWHLLSPLIGGRAIEYLLGYSSTDTGPDGQSQSPGLQAPASTLLRIGVAQIGIACLATGFFSVPWLVALYPVSAGTFTLFFARLRTFAEHVEPPKGSYSDFTRSHEPNWWDAVFLYDANFGYHLEHHLYPHIPSCFLADVYRRYGDLIHRTPETRRSSMFGTILWRFAEAGK